MEKNNVSYSIKLKKEILNVKNKKENEVMSELLGLFLSKNSFTQDGIYFKTEINYIARRVFENLKMIPNLFFQFSYSRHNKLGTHNVYVIKIEKQKNNENIYNDFIAQLFNLKTYDVTKAENKEITSGIIRGYFLSCGYVKDPLKGYSLDFFIDTEDASTFLYLLFLNMGKKVFQTEKKNKNIVYIRNCEDILDTIILLGGVTCFFEYEEVTINKEISSKINRNINYELANETKKMKTSLEQVEMINKIDETIGIKTLSYALQETARVRLENEDMSLEELAGLLNITKSGIRGRFRKLKEIYEDIGE
ncbi:DNA-binding protein WhiA [Caviibacter abscessus]|uniref:DNA-binding protein WhiA n=1 Tax=Caviibacter abscessus TaxID=1766719 RepID=UPI0008303EC1|nr:DNA-binding protein WhiA [Caviibacter abscessus]